jgi:hypothetical protein
VLAVDCLQAAVAAAGWDAGVPHRQARGLPPRADLDGGGTREPCTLGAGLPPRGGPQAVVAGPGPVEMVPAK